MPKKFKHIAIEGNIGVGKTTLAKYLSKLLEADLLLENFEDNPYLEKFYMDKSKHAFATEMFFFNDRIRQLSSMNSNNNTVSDFTILKSKIFASINLSEQDFKLFNEKFTKINLEHLYPDLIIYLHNEPENLLQNITKRGRNFESEIKNEYLLQISNSYNTFFRNQNDLPVIYLPSEKLFYPYQEKQIWEILTKCLSVEHKGLIVYE